MATAATIVFVLSGLMMAAFVFFKRRETARGSGRLSAFRAKLDWGVIEGSIALRDWLPERGAPFIRRAASQTAYGTALLSLRTLQFLEKRLLSVIRLINGERTVARRDTASGFLRSVAEQKKHNKSERARVKREADKMIQ